MIQQQSLLPNLYDCTLADLEALLASWGQPKFRAKQVYRQLYVNLAHSFDAMTDLPIPLRERLAQETRLGSLTLRREQTADAGDTRKTLWSMPGDAVIESVLMRYPDRATVCVSTQAGCAMGCVFCATGRMGLLRNVSTGEIIEQVLWAARTLQGGHRDMETSRRGDKTDEYNAASPNPYPLTPNSRLTNLVFMGMGEPFANYDRWWTAVERLHDPQGFNFGARNMTVSTVGLVPGIRRLAGERLPINLAVSLHAPNDALRGALMPVNNRYPLRDLLDAVQDYIQQTRRRVSFEYVLLQGQNDSVELAHELADLVGGMLCHVNLIPWNPVPGTPLHRSHRRQVEAFQGVLLDRGIACTVRVERGMAIAAACGQLAAISEVIPLQAV